ncbi:hypothetical protein LUZ60_012111 [Juncus effusus]|nr:hypothetical protein LUZ60_012111 [Juncus effusus]
MWQGLKEKGIKDAAFILCSSKRGIVVFVGFLLVVLITSRYASNFTSVTGFTGYIEAKHSHKSLPIQTNISCPINASELTCSPPSQSLFRSPAKNPSSPSCPQFFRYIHEDLKPWKSSGITKEMVESAQPHATFRLVVLEGRAYLLQYRGTYRPRDVFTIWGIVQFLNRYQGQIPDLDFMFNCDDFPEISAADYLSSPPPPLFRYCKDNRTLDILFPDWTFWGWPDVNIRPWELILEEFKTENVKSNWRDRQPYAYWKGNPDVANIRKDLMTCNVSDEHDYNARLYNVDWWSERIHGFKESNLAKECTYRFKIYVEGCAWSVSEKYILACNSPMLFIDTHFIDFYTRGLMPGKHYWPIRSNQKCKSIKYAVDWGNKHQKESEEMGRAGSLFTQQELSMENVYQYMLHLLTEYSKLMKYKPSIPENATEICSESLACDSMWKDSFLESLATTVYDSEPCQLAPPFDTKEIEEIESQKRKFVREIERQEDEWKE